MRSFTLSNGRDMASIDGNNEAFDTPSLVTTSPDRERKKLSSRRKGKESSLLSLTNDPVSL